VAWISPQPALSPLQPALSHPSASKNDVPPIELPPQSATPSNPPPTCRDDDSTALADELEGNEGGDDDEDEYDGVDRDDDEAMILAALKGRGGFGEFLVQKLKQAKPTSAIQEGADSIDCIPYEAETDDDGEWDGFAPGDGKGDTEDTPMPLRNEPAVVVIDNQEFTVAISASAARVELFRYLVAPLKIQQASDVEQVDLDERLVCIFIAYYVTALKRLAQRTQGGGFYCMRDECATLDSGFGRLGKRFTVRDALQQHLCVVQASNDPIATPSDECLCCVGQVTSPVLHATR
jgi:hypothetical protein